MENKEWPKEWLIEARNESNYKGSNILNFVLKSINAATYNDIISKPKDDKYKNIVLVIRNIELLKDSDLSDIMTKGYGRWHESGDPLKVFPLYADRHKRNLVQGWYSKTELLKLMTEKLEPKAAWVIIKRVR